MTGLPGACDCADVLVFGHRPVCDHGGYRAALPHGVGYVDNPTMYLVRDVEDVAVRDHALHRVVVEQRSTRMPAQDEREHPSEVVAVLHPELSPSPPNGLER